MKKISVIIPAHNEERNIVATAERLASVFFLLPEIDYEIIFVNDGSTDNTQKKIEEMSLINPSVKFIELSRNFGGQTAIKAGIDHVFADAVITMDGDLQHPPELIPQMIRKWEGGFDVVNMYRIYSQDTSLFKKKTSEYFYRILNRISDIRVAEGESDFKLFDYKVLETVQTFNENELFLRGVYKWIGFKQTSLRYDADDRYEGFSKYSTSKLIKLAVSGLTAFSDKPLHIASYLGFIFTGLAAFLYLINVYRAFYLGTAISGWASLILTIVFFGGMQMSILGIIGLYIGKIFNQVKYRPNYIIRSKNF